jgi:HD superfamily phosphohydrolase
LGLKDEKQLNLIKCIIKGERDGNEYSKLGFLFQIVTNNQNNITVDLIDSITRDAHFTGKKISADFKTIFKGCRIEKNELMFPKKVSYFTMLILN